MKCHEHTKEKEVEETREQEMERQHQTYGHSCCGGGKMAYIWIAMLILLILLSLLGR